MVRTPWFAEEIPFEDAAKIGTLKVIKEHATIGVVVTTDGSFGEIGRNSYIEAENRSIAEMEDTGKPYIILLNSERPHSAETEMLRVSLEEKYGRPVIAVNCKQMQKSDIVRILESVLLEFPITTVEFYIPKWTEMLDNEHPVKKDLIAYGMDWLGRVTKMRDLYDESGDVISCGDVNSMCIPFVRKIRTSDGTVELRMDVDDTYYYDYLSDITGESIASEYQLIHMIQSLAKKKQEYEKVEDAMNSVTARGYGVVAPSLMDITMEEPELITHAGKYGVKIRANSPSIHMIRANIETEIAPIVGNKERFGKRSWTCW